ERPNIITFGSPCQDFSLAGKRKGMEGERSSLITEAIRLINECRPDIFIWENVKGTFSSNDGADFWGIVQAFANIGGYRLEWQLLNTSWFLPQNRERIYLIGHLDGRSRPKVFPFRETDFIYIKNNGHEKPGVANCIDSNYGKGWLDHGQRTHIVKPVLTPDRLEKRQNGRRFKEDGEPAHTLTGQDRHGVMITGVSMERTEEGKALRKDYESGKITHGFNEFRKPTPRKDGLTNTLDTNQKSQLILEETKIRRLTEQECEILQGFPIDWTKYGNYNGEIKEVSMTQRYKMCGNAVTCRVVEEIGKRLLNQ